MLLPSIINSGRSRESNRARVDALLLELAFKLAAVHDALRSAYSFCLVSFTASCCSNTTISIFNGILRGLYRDQFVRHLPLSMLRLQSLVITSLWSPSLHPMTIDDRGVNGAWNGTVGGVAIPCLIRKVMCPTKARLPPLH